MVGDTKGSEMKAAEVILLWEVHFYKTAGGWSRRGLSCGADHQ